MVEVGCGRVGEGDFEIGAEGNIFQIDDCLGCRAEQVQEVCPYHVQDEVDTEERFVVRWDCGYHKGKGAYILRTYVALVECVGDIPFAHEDWAVCGVGFPYLLE